MSAAPAPADLPLGELLHNPTARAVLAQVLGPMLDSPMIAQMHGMSLKKLLSMGGQALPPEVLAGWTKPAAAESGPPHGDRRGPDFRGSPFSCSTCTSRYSSSSFKYEI